MVLGTIPAQNFIAGMDAGLRPKGGGRMPPVPLLSAADGEPKRYAFWFSEFARSANSQGQMAGSYLTKPFGPRKG
jgi:hypothetical protein